MLNETKVNSKADGSFSQTTFSYEEIQIADNIKETYRSIISKSGHDSTPNTFSESIKNSITIPSQTEYNASNRIERAISFLDLARNSSLLPQKISFYVLVFECLFSADQKDEILHKVSERAALYIGTNLEDRVKVFKEVKKLYNIRSKYVHGQTMDISFNTIEKLIPLSIMADNYARKILTKVIMEDSELFLKDGGELNDYFNKQLFKDAILPDNLIA